METNKHDQICEAYWKLRSQVQADPEYARMREALEKLEQQYEAILNTLDGESREVIERYILLRESMSSRMLEFACVEMLFGGA